MEIMKILILGDVGASKNNEQAFCNADTDLFSEEIQDVCSKADIVLLNLEKPLTNQLTPLGKCPPDYIAPEKTINGIKLLNPTAATLANNHIMDQREQGMKSTIETLLKNGIQYVGVGNNLSEARKPLIIEKQGIRIGIYACCEKEFSFATDKTPGANVFDPLVTFDDIEEINKNCDYLIVLFHGGMQEYPYPTPYQQKVCRKMCEKGADLVVCQHSHIIGCEEKYLQGTIIYGQGNFLLDDVDSDSWNSGLLVEVDIDKAGNAVKYIPIKTKAHKAIINPENKQVMDGFEKRSKEAANPEAVDQMFAELSNLKISDYLIKLSGKSTIIQKIYRRLGITKTYKKRYSKETCNRMLDYLYCDSHREAIEYGLSQHIKEKERKQ